MAEPYNFPKHLREILGKPLYELGFKQKRCSFIRETSNFREKIYFTRNEFKNRGFKVFLIVGSNFADDSWVCLNHLLTNTYIQEKGDGKLNTFTDKPINEFLEYRTQTYWRYNSEDELKKILLVVLAAVINIGLPYFSGKYDLIKF